MARAAVIAGGEAEMAREAALGADGGHHPNEAIGHGHLGLRSTDVGVDAHCRLDADLGVGRATEKE